MTSSDRSLHLEVHGPLGTALQVGRLVLRLPAPFPAHPPAGAARGDELAFLWRAASEPDAPPGVVLAGPPGRGKSALALRWAYQACDLFPGGLHHLDLRGSPAAVPPPPGGGRTLLIIDAASAEAEVRPFLPASEAFFTLVVSRDPLPGLIVDGFRFLAVRPPGPPSPSLAFLLPRLMSAPEALPPEVVTALLHAAQTEAEETGDHATHAAVSLRLARLHAAELRTARSLHCYALALDSYANIGDTAAYARTLREAMNLQVNPLQIITFLLFHSVDSGREPDERAA